MPIYTSTAGVSGLTPADYGPLIIEPVQEASVAFPVATRVATIGSTFHVPILQTDSGASWVAEGAEITSTDATFAELVIQLRKVAGLNVISRELANDSSPAAAAIVGQSIARSIARKVDEAFFGDLPAPAAPGLGSITPSIVTAASLADLDSFAEAVSLAESEGVNAADLTFVANPGDGLVLSQVKSATGSNLPLLVAGGDAATATQRQVLGVPMVVSPAVELGVIWCIPRSRALIVLREDVSVEVSSDAYFSSDRIGVRAVMRLSFAYPAPFSVVRLDLA